MSGKKHRSRTYGHITQLVDFQKKQHKKKMAKKGEGHNGAIVKRLMSKWSL